MTTRHGGRSAARAPGGAVGWSYLVLVGLMATGKTTVGRALAGRLGIGFDDNDSRLAETANVTPAELRRREGVATLHAREAGLLLAALQAPGPRVITAAASVVESDAVREALLRPDVFTIWLRASPSTLAARFAHPDHRPVYADDMKRFFEQQLVDRGPLFREVSDAVIDVDGRSVDEIVEQALAAASAG
jgi:shikimate kinase